ncbi:PIN domain-containing protein [Candidatus Woesearchaeota archaeon]|nr:PIN domain-containing protein [Candidatus Woesearchaeota archaeon]
MILDTTFLIDLTQNDKGAVEQKQFMAARNETCRVSVATIFELWSGVTSSNRSEEEKRKVITALFGLALININRSIAEKAGEINGMLLKSGNMIEPLDTMIAATALLENEALLTRNVKHFSRVKGLRIESY